MNEAVIIVCTLAILLSCIALTIGCIAIALVVGLKNSTHTIQWKTLDNPHTSQDEEEIPGLEEEESNDPLAENPLKRKKKESEPAPQADFPFMEDVTDQNGF